MSDPAARISAQFRAWEERGRGWQVYEDRVALEPPFRPFLGYSLPSVSDDGRKPTVGSSILQGLSQLFASQKGPEESDIEDEEDEPGPQLAEGDELVEIPTILPLSRSVPAEQVESFLRHVCRNAETLGLELLGTERETTWQLVASPHAVTRVLGGVETYFPGITCTPPTDPTEDGDSLLSAWQNSDASFAAVELGLGSECMLPLGNPRSDILPAAVAALDGLGKEELGLIQILFAPTTEAWPESMVRAVSDAKGAPLFSNRPDLLRGAQRKTATPLFAVVVRLVGSAASPKRAWEVIGDIAAPFSAFAKPGTNFFAPLRNDEYPADAHEEDILARGSRRPGMLLSLEELIPLISPPVSATSKRLRRQTKRTNAAPMRSTVSGSLHLGTNRHAGITNEVWLTPEDRVRHCHIIGASGTGKSTLLFNLIRQDIENGQGVAVLDPHGDLVDRLLGIIPPERIADVVLIDPSDEEYSVGFNILAAHSDFEKALLASDLVGVFQRLSTSWGDQMNSVLRNAILAFLESTEGGTLADLRRFLLDGSFRNRFLSTVTDPEIVFYWQKAFPQLTGGKSVGPVVTRLDEFLSRKPIRYMVSQKTNRLNFAEVIDRGQILLAKLPQGLIGRENSYLLGSLILSKIQQVAMGRQRMKESERRDFWCYVDEFHSFITPSMAEILTGARKYRVGLTLAHQELRQLQASEEVASAVLANAFTRVVFRVGDADARSLENGFTHFEAKDLQNLEIGEAVCRIERSDSDFNLEVSMPDPTVEDEFGAREEIIATSRAAYARSRVEIEAEAQKKLSDEDNEPASRKKAVVVPEPPTPPAPKSETNVPVKPAEAAPVAEAPTPPVPREPADLGRGGAQHQAIQLKLKTAAEEVGFKVTVEKSVLDGQGSIDLLLEREGEAIACEINVMSSLDDEIKNVRKCLKAGYTKIAVVCSRADRLFRLEEAVKGCFAPEQAALVTFHSPDAFVSFVQTPGGAASAPPADAPIEKRRRGYKVKSHFVKVSDEDAKAREEAAIKMLAEKLRRDQDSKA